MMRVNYFYNKVTSIETTERYIKFVIFHAIGRAI